jgi:hypothetical protein
MGMTHRCSETDTRLAVPCQDDPLRPAAVTQGIPDRADGPLEGRRIDEATRPQLRAQLLPGYDPISVLQEIEAHPENFRPQPNGLSTPPHTV